MSKHLAVSTARTFTRVRAVLAGALVLGVGATVTLASWTDSEFARGSFSASTFDTQSSVNGTDYADNVNPPVATIAFSGSGMSPTTHRYGYLLVRTKPGSVGGTLQLAAATVTDGGAAPLLSAALQYRAIVTTSTTCDATVFTSGATYAAGAFSGTTHVSLTAAPLSPTVTLAAATSTVAGSAIGYCFDVTLPTGASTALQGKSATALWSVTATSSS